MCSIAGGMVILSNEEDERPFYRPGELAKVLSVAHATVLNWIRRGDVKANRYGRVYRIPHDEYQRVLDKGVGGADGDSE